jgi:DNA-binding transcriptional MocR family regulator
LALEKDYAECSNHNSDSFLDKKGYSLSFKYQDLADTLNAQIDSGQRHPGERLPSVRDLSRQTGVSLNTALRAYEWLEQTGRVLAVPQSGFYVCHRATGPSEPVQPDFTPCPTRIENADLIAAIQQTANDPARVPLGTAMLAPSLLPLDALRQSLARVSRTQADAAATYAPAEGEPALRRALAAHCRQDGLPLDADDLLITNGCMSALGLALLSVSAEGDSIALPSPCYSGQLRLLASLKRRVVEIPCPAQRLDLDRLEHCMASGQVRACLISANFHNPLGFCLAPEDKMRIAELAARHDCPVIEDDVFGECGHGGPRPLPIKYWDRAGQVIWCGSFSKSLASGYRIGWCAPGRYTSVIDPLQRSMQLAVNRPLQLALADFLLCGAYRRHLRRLQPALAGQADALRQAVMRHFPSGCQLSRPRGGYALWVRLSAGGDGMALYRAASEDGINIVPGAAFSARGLYADCVRLNAGNPWSDVLETAVARLGQRLREGI